MERPAHAPVAPWHPEVRRRRHGAREPEDGRDGQDAERDELVEEWEAAGDEEVGEDDERPDGAEDEEVVRVRGVAAEGVGDVGGQAEDNDCEDDEDAG